MLKALYSRYRLKPSGGGLRPKVLRLDGWLALMAVSSGWSNSFGWQLRCGINNVAASRGYLQVTHCFKGGHRHWLAGPCVRHFLSCRVYAVPQEARLIDSQFTLVDATLAFLWSRMFVIDEIKDYVRYDAGALRLHQQAIRSTPSAAAPACSESSKRSL